MIRNDDEANAVGGFLVPRASIGVLILATVIASMLATLWPARQAT